MSLVNNNISPLPFYDDILQQNHRKDYAFGQVYPLITYKNTLLPFQVVLTKVVVIKAVVLYNFNTGRAMDITASMLNNGLELIAFEDFTLLKYSGLLPIAEITKEGRYYLEVVLAPTKLAVRTISIYSEVFTVTNRIEDYLLLEYSNSYNFKLNGGVIDFSDNFKFKCYLPTQIGKPEYNFEEEVTTRMGYSFMESQVSKKVYRFTFLAPEYLCDALRIVRLCENKQIISKNQVYNLTTFSMEPEWEEQGDLASVECSFETDTVIANIGGYAPKKADAGDFSNDFNNDFNK